MAKTASFAVTHFTVAFGVAYALTGDPVIGGTLALVEPAVNTLAYHVHEKGLVAYPCARLARRGIAADRRRARVTRIDVRRMDVHLLYSLVNTRLRNEYADLDDLARGLDLERAELEQRLAEAGYRYSAELRQFRRVE